MNAATPPIAVSTRRQPHRVAFIKSSEREGRTMPPQAEAVNAYKYPRHFQLAAQFPRQPNRLPSSADPHRPDEMVIVIREVCGENLWSAAALPPPCQQTQRLHLFHSGRLRRCPHYVVILSAAKNLQPTPMLRSPNQRSTKPPTPPVAASFSWAICLCINRCRPPLPTLRRHSEHSEESRPRQCFAAPPNAAPSRPPHL